MKSSKTYNINMTSEQKELFSQWLEDIKNDLEVKLENINSLRSQIEDNTTTSIQPLNSKMVTSDGSSWTSKTIHALKKLGGVQTSAAVISWLMENNDGGQNRDKRSITKIVTSKLSLLVDKGQIEKKVIDGKNFYRLKNAD